MCAVGGVVRRRTVTGRGTVTYESTAVEWDSMYRMIHESWPQGV